MSQTTYTVTTTKTNVSPAAAIIIPIIVILVGIAFMSTLYVMYQNYAKFESIAKFAQGEVTSLETERFTVERTGRRDRTSTVYAAVVTFVDQNGNTQVFTSGFPADPPTHRVGDIVEVMYDPASPEIAEIRSLANPFNNILSMVPAGIGLLVTLFGLGLFKALRPAPKAKPQNDQAQAYVSTSPIS